VLAAPQRGGVHRKNSKRDDNRPENLELWVSRHPKGQRAEGLVTFAQEFLRDYQSWRHDLGS
jgi:hypothetical protein